MSVQELPVPHDLEAERAVLGALLVRGEFPSIEEVANLEPRHFFRDAHRVIFDKMRALQCDGQTIDLVTLRSALGPKSLDLVGGPAYITALTDGVPQSTNVHAYASVVRNCADARAMIATFDRARTRLYQDPAAASNGLVADVALELEAIRHVPTSRPTFQLIDDVEMIARPEPPMLISGILTAGSSAGLFAPPGYSKTFTIVELLVCVATGRTFFGTLVPQSGNVLHVLGEGAGLFGRRLAAVKQKHGIPVETAIGYYTLPESVDMLNAESVSRLITAAQHVSPMLVALDTVQRNMRGNENASEDMAAFVAGVDRIRHELGCAVIVVHHTGWDEKRERGSNVLRASVDTLLSLRRGDGDVLTLSCEKQRDIEPFTPFLLRQVTLGNSCVMQLASVTSEHSPNEQTALETLRNLYTGSAPVASRKWRDASRLTERTFERVKRALLESNHVERIKGQYRPVQKVANPLPPVEEATATLLP